MYIQTAASCLHHRFAINQLCFDRCMTQYKNLQRSLVWGHHNSFDKTYVLPCHEVVDHSVNSCILSCVQCSIACGVWLFYLEPNNYLMKQFKCCISWVFPLVQFILYYIRTYQTHYIIRALIPYMSEQFLSSWQELWKPCKHSSQPLPPKFSSVLVMKWSDWKPCLKCLSYVGSPLIANIDGATLLQCSSLPKIRIPKANGHNANGFNGCVCML